MSKFNEKFKEFFEAVEDVYSKMSQIFKSFAGQLPKEFVGASIHDASPKGKKLLFNYEKGPFKVPMEIRVNVMDDEFIISSDIADDSLTTKETRHTAAKYVPQELGTIITNTKNDAEFTAKVQSVFDKLVKGGTEDRYVTDGPKTLDEVRGEIENHIKFLNSVLGETANGIIDMASKVSPSKDEEEPKTPVKGLKKSVSNMDDDELDAEFFRRRKAKENK